MYRSIEEDLPKYVAATSEDIRTWSRGAVKRRLRHEERRDDWRQVEGTLWDEHIFGPTRDYECACGRFAGREAAGTICPSCRVKVMSSQARTFRFGHINLLVKIPHPFIAGAEPLDAIPVVPAINWQSHFGQPLAEAYEEIVHLSLIEAADEEIVGAYGVVLAHLERLYGEAPAHDPDQIERLARGMALKVKPPEEEDIEYEDWGELKLADE